MLMGCVCSSLEWGAVRSAPRKMHGWVGVERTSFPDKNIDAKDDRREHRRSLGKHDTS